MKKCTADCECKAELRELRSFDTVVAKLGGSGKVGELVGKNASHVANWKRERGVIPPRYYLVFCTALALQGYEPALSVFGFVKPSRRLVEKLHHAPSVIVKVSGGARPPAGRVAHKGLLSRRVAQHLAGWMCVTPLLQPYFESLVTIGQSG